MALTTGAVCVTGLVAAVLVGLWLAARRRFWADAQAFTCRVRRPARARPRRWRRWRRPAHARWIHDELVLQSGPFGLSAAPHVTRIAAGAALRPLSADQVGGLGGRPWALLLRTDDGGPLDVAVSEADRELLVGPYLTAAVTALPSVRPERNA